MGLGNRYTGVRRTVNHDTVGLRARAVNAELWHVFHAGQRVQTVDGISGVVAAVEDGPFPGAEQYVVELDQGLGGGQYTAGQLTALGPAQASEVHTAADDYPEMGSILHDRPDIAKRASHKNAAGECALCGEEPGSSKWFGSAGCPSCGAQIPHEVEAKDSRIHLNGKPWSHDGGDPQFSSFVDTYQGKGEATLVDRAGKEHSGTGDTETEAAQNAVRNWGKASMPNAGWEPRPSSYFRKLDRHRED